MKLLSFALSNYLSFTILVLLSAARLAWGAREGRERLKDYAATRNLLEHPMNIVSPSSFLEAIMLSKPAIVNIVKNSSFSSELVANYQLTISKWVFSVSQWQYYGSCSWSQCS